MEIPDSIPDWVVEEDDKALKQNFAEFFGVSKEKADAFTEEVQDARDDMREWIAEAATPEQNGAIREIVFAVRLKTYMNQLVEMGATESDDMVDFSVQLAAMVEKLVEVYERGDW